MRTRRTRLARATAAIVAAVLLLTTLMLSPASAGGWTDNGPGDSGSNGGSSGVQTGSGDYRCGQRIGGTPGVLYRKIDGKWLPWFEYGYQSCVGKGPSSNWNNTGYTELCPSGFLVYRFYGTPQEPAAAVTRSRVNLTNWCNGESGYSFPAANPFDAGQNVGAPWKAIEGRNQDLYYSQHPNPQYFRNDAGQLTTGYSTRVRGQCTSVQTAATMRSWFDRAGQNERIALRAALGTDYWVASGKGQRPATGQAEAGIRNVRGYPFRWSQWTQDKTKPPAPTSAASADGFYLTSFDWEERDCASPFQFLNSTEADPTTRTVIGTCYVPLLRKRTQLRNVNTGQIGWKYPTLQRDSRQGWGDGERLSLFYRGTSYTPNGSGGDTLDRSATGLSARQQANLIAGWRDAMITDYRAWWNKGLYNAAGAQVVPVNAYVGESSRSRILQSTQLDQSAAAQQLWESARCRVGTQVSFDAPKNYEFPDLDATADVRVVDQQVFQVSPTTVEVTLTGPSTLTCDDGGCPPGTSLTTLSWNARIDGTRGYRLYQAKSPSDTIPQGYDGLVYSRKVTANGRTRSETFTVRFLRPTQPTQYVRLTISDLKGTFTQVVQTDGLKIDGLSPYTGQRYTIDTGALQAQQTSPLTVTASATPKALTRTSPTSYEVLIPVVGAVQVPVTR